MGTDSKSVIILPNHFFVTLKLYTQLHESYTYGNKYEGHIKVNICDARYQTKDPEACLSLKLSPGVALPASCDELDQDWVRETETTVLNQILADVGKYMHEIDDAPYFEISEYGKSWEQVFLNSANEKFGKSVDEEYPF
jgi:hypothetical protein